MADPKTSVFGLLFSIGSLLVWWSPTAYPWIGGLGAALVALAGGAGLHFAADARKPADSTPEPAAKSPEAPPAVVTLPPEEKPQG